MADDVLSVRRRRTCDSQNAPIRTTVRLSHRAVVARTGKTARRIAPATPILTQLHAYGVFE
jgi:hypothetical protein